ncbi:MAG: radical SAM protein [Deltaproteobacteria bacterium]|nr:radical SAM protein [Deltaproteobacteria bacterium]
MNKKIRYASVEEVAECLNHKKFNSGSVCLLVGAGISFSAGIPLSRDIIRILKAEYPNMMKKAKDPSYFGYMKALSEKQRHDLIDKCLSQGSMNMSHLCIAALIRYGFIDRVLTTNFDILTEKALDHIGFKNYTPYDLATNYAVLNSERLDRISIVYLHGRQKGMWLLNTPQEIADIKKKLGSLLDECNGNRTWIVVGYSADKKEAVFRALSGIERFSSNLYWIGHQNAEPNTQLKNNILQKKDTYFIKGEDADSFFSKLTEKLNIRVELSDFFRPKECIDLKDIDTSLTESGRKEAAYIFKTDIENIKCIAYKITNSKNKKSYLHRIYIRKAHFKKIEPEFLKREKKINIIKTLANKLDIQLFQEKTHQFEATTIGEDDIVMGLPATAHAMLHCQITYKSDPYLHLNESLDPVEFLISKFTEHNPIRLHGNLIDIAPKLNYGGSMTGEDLYKHAKIREKLVNINKRFFYPFTIINMKVDTFQPLPESGKPKKLLRIVIAPEDRCNYNCVFCCQTKYKSARKCKKNGMNDIVDLIIKAATESGCTRIMLTGGEPLLTNEVELLEIIKKISDQKNINDFWLCTNGSLLTKRLCQFFFKNGLRKVVVTIGAETSRKYRVYTGQNKISLDSIFRNIKIAVACGLSVKVDVPLHKKGITNAKELLILVEKIRKVGVREMAYFKIHKTPHNEPVFNDLYVEPDLITWELLNHSSWQVVTRANGQKVFSDEKMAIIIPAANKKYTNNCKQKKCQEYCQGVYAMYLKKNGPSFNLQACHRSFIAENTVSEVREEQLPEHFQNLWNWAYQNSDQNPEGSVFNTNK